MKNSGVYGGSLINADPYQKCCDRDHNSDGNCDRHSAPGIPRRVVRVGREIVEHAGQLLAFPIVNLPGGCTIIPIHGWHYPHFLVRQNSSELVDEYLAVFTDDRQAIELIKIGT
jgi:hypothetical protein